MVSPEPAALPRLPPWAAPNGWDYWGRPWAYIDAPSGHAEVGVSSTLSPPSNRVTVALLVDCPHEPQFLPDMLVAQSAAVVTGRAMRQARPLTQKGEISENMTLETAARRLLPRTYGDSYSVAVLEQLKAWESFRTLNIGRRENPTMPRGDVTPSECPRAKLHGKAPETLSGRPTMTARAAETTCKSQASSTSTAPADQKLKQRPVVDLPRMEMPASASSQADPSDQGPVRQWSVLLPRSLKQCLWKWIPKGRHPLHKAPVLAQQYVLKRTGRVLRTHRFSRLVNASARIRRLSNAPLISRAFALWLQTSWSVRALNGKIGSNPKGWITG